MMKTHHFAGSWEPPCDSGFYIATCWLEPITAVNVCKQEWKSLTASRGVKTTEKLFSLLPLSG